MDIYRHYSWLGIQWPFALDVLHLPLYGRASTPEDLWNGFCLNSHKE